MARREGIAVELKRADATGSSVGLGLLSMKERVALLRGDFRIWSKPGQGTEAMVAVPLGAQ